MIFTHSNDNALAKKQHVNNVNKLTTFFSSIVFRFLPGSHGLPSRNLFGRWRW